MRQLFYATSNPGKIAEVRSLVSAYGIELIAPPDLDLTLDVPESGTTLEANATLKAEAYRTALADRAEREQYVVIADDTGIEIDALDGAPGIHVRRWDGSARMTDEAIIEYCMAQLRDVPPTERGAQFRTVIAVGAADQPITCFDGTLRGIILPEPDPLRMAGFPFESIFFVPEWDMLLGHAHQLPAEDRATLVTHRARAVARALPHIQTLLTI